MMSSSASGTSGAESIGAGLASSSDEMKVLKQHPGNFLKFFLRTKRELAEAIDSCGTRERPTVVRACFEREPSERLRRAPRRGWLRDLPAKGSLPQNSVYIGRSYGAFYQPQGWENPFRPDPRKGKQGLQEVVDAYEQHLSQSQILVDRLPELSGKVLYCHCKLAVYSPSAATCVSF